MICKCRMQGCLLTVLLKRKKNKKNSTTAYLHQIGLTVVTSVYEILIVFEGLTYQPKQSSNHLSMCIGMYRMYTHQRRSETERISMSALSSF